MTEPIQAPPVRRPELVDPTTFYTHLDQMTEQQWAYLQMKFAFDMNFNDPQAFVFPSADRMRFSSWPGH